MAFRIFQRKAAGPRPSPAPGPAVAPPSGAGGCLLCGEGPAAAAAPSPGSTCALCGQPGPVAERCRAGHVVCAACLAAPPAFVIERTCAVTEERDPVAIAVRLTRHPDVRLAPQDHDLLVPAALVAAWSNVRGEGDRRAARVRAVAARVPRVAPSGRPDGRGAAAGAGAFVSLAAEEGRRAADAALVDRAAARAKALIGDGDDALCVRRNALVSILATARFAREHLGADLPARGISCERAGQNPSCIGASCPFNR